MWVIIGIIIIIIIFIKDGTSNQKGCAWFIVIFVGIILILTSLGVSSEDLPGTLLTLFILAVFIVLVWLFANMPNKEKSKNSLQKSSDADNLNALHSQNSKVEIDIQINKLMNKKLSLYQKLFDLQRQLNYELEQRKKVNIEKQLKQEIEPFENDDTIVHESKLTSLAENNIKTIPTFKNSLSKNASEPKTVPKDYRDKFYKNITVAGAQFVTPKALENLLPNEEITLVREPCNKYDANAIALYRSNNRKIGYLFRTDNPSLAKARIKVKSITVL